MAEVTVEELKNRLRGEIIQPSDNGYDDARKVYNAMIDRRPALIARCADVADVIAAVNFGRENDMLTAIRGGSAVLRSIICWPPISCLPMGVS